MQNWVYFINLLFWVSLFCFLFNNYNIIQLLLLSEACWVIIYSYTTIMSGLTDDLTLLTLTFFILGLAGLEFSLGFILVIVLNNVYKNTLRVYEYIINVVLITVYRNSKKFSL